MPNCFLTYVPGQPKEQRQQGHRSSNPVAVNQFYFRKSFLCYVGLILRLLSFYFIHLHNVCLFSAKLLLKKQSNPNQYNQKSICTSKSDTVGTRTADIAVMAYYDKESGTDCRIFPLFRQNVVLRVKITKIVQCIF